MLTELMLITKWAQRMIALMGLAHGCDGMDLSFAQTCATYTLPAQAACDVCERRAFWQLQTQSSDSFASLKSKTLATQT